MSDGLVTTGIAGLDHILRGGLPSDRLYLVQGDPGVGKTTLALQYLLEGARQGQRGLYVTFSESRAEIQSVAESHAWSLEDLEIFEFGQARQALEGERAGTVFHPAETEMTAIMSSVAAAIARVTPHRMVFDSLSELRLLAGDPLRYRRQILEFKALLSKISCTALLLDDRTATRDDLQLQSLAHGVLSLYRTSANFGSAKRKIEIVKLRGVAFRDGVHDFAISTGGIKLFPRLIASEHHGAERGILSSGVPELDSLLGGGIERGSGTLLLGPAGAGKSTVALRFAISAAMRGERSVIYVFDESVQMLRSRAAGLNLDVGPYEKRGLIDIRPIDASEVTPGQFAASVHDSVEEGGARIVIIDSLNGYLNAMPDEKHLVLHLHELLAYAAARGVAVLMVISQQGMMGSQMQQPVDASYLADTVVLFRYYEFAGEIRQAISVFKRRGGAHDRTIRALTIGPPQGIAIGAPLRELRGVLSGTPTPFVHADSKE